MIARTLLLAGIVAVMPAATSNDMAAVELHAKAGFLYNFARFTVWPTNSLPGATNALIIGVIGQDALCETLKPMLTGKRIDQHKVECRRYANVTDVRECHVLYIGCSEAERLPEILRSLTNAPVLTVGDMPGFAERGGMVALTKTNDRIAFDVNLTGTRRAGLTISSKLLRLAGKIVEPVSGQEPR